MLRTATHIEKMFRLPLHFQPTMCFPRSSSSNMQPFSPWSISPPNTSLVFQQSSPSDDFRKVRTSIQPPLKRKLDYSRLAEEILKDQESDKYALHFVKTSSLLPHIPDSAIHSVHFRKQSAQRKRFPCSYCTHCSTSSSNLKVHEEKHLNIRSYQCQICQKKFRRPSTEIYRHRKLWCVVDRCLIHELFCFLDHLHDHQFTHSKEKPYRCNGKMDKILH